MRELEPECNLDLGLQWRVLANQWLTDLAASLLAASAGASFASDLLRMCGLEEKSNDGMENFFLWYGMVRGRSQVPQKSD